MQEWINSVLSADQAGVIVLAAVFLLGAISVFTCACSFAVIGAVAGYTGTLGATGKTKTVITSSLFFFLGYLVAMSALGCVIGFAGELVSASLGNYWKIASGIILIFFGVYTLDILPFKIPGISLKSQNKQSGIAGAALFGFSLGGVTSLSALCCNPVFPIIMAASFTQGSMFWGFLMLFFYAVGHGVMYVAAMIGVGLGLGKISKIFSKFAVFIKYAGGITLIILGFYFLLTF
jgi:cytochrome c biogenesis protein CcdA